MCIPAERKHLSRRQRRRRRARPALKGAEKLLFARTHARMRVVFAPTRRRRRGAAGSPPFIHPSTQHTGCDDSRRHSREKKSRRVRVRRRRAPFQPIVNNKLVFFRQPRSLAARVRARARASAVGDFATPRVRPRRQKTPTAPTVYGTNPIFYHSTFV